MKTCIVILLLYLASFNCKPLDYAGELENEENNDKVEVSTTSENNNDNTIGEIKNEENHEVVVSTTSENSNENTVTGKEAVPGNEISSNGDNIQEDTGTHDCIIRIPDLECPLGYRKDILGACRIIQF